jgi:maleate isomerase
MANHRVGLIVPSSNVTVETEMPALLRRHETASFSFHSSRTRMHTVSLKELRTMNEQMERCVAELADAEVDTLLYACLVAVMAIGPGEHRRVEQRAREMLVERDDKAAVRSSAGALIEGLAALKVRRIALVTPYVRPLAEKVVGYIEEEGFEVSDWRCLEVADNAEVGRVPGTQIMDAARSLDLEGVDALVLSACVQMPSLDLIESAEEEFGIPVLSAATAGAYSLLTALGEAPRLPGAGRLLQLTAGSSESGGISDD